MNRTADSLLLESTISPFWSVSPGCSRVRMAVSSRESAEDSVGMRAVSRPLSSSGVVPLRIEDWVMKIGRNVTIG